MRVRSTRQRELGPAQVELRGHVTDVSGTALRRVLAAAMAAGLKHVIVDLRALDDADIHLGFTLLDFDRRLSCEGGWLWLAYGAGNVGSSLRHLGVHDRVHSSPTRAAAGWHERQQASAGRALRSCAPGA